MPPVTENHRFDDKRPFVDKQADFEVLPMDGKVYVEPDFGSTKTASGIELGKSRKTAIPNTGWIVQLGDDITDMKIGEYVIFDDVQSKGFWARGVAHIPLKREQIIAFMPERNR